MFTQKFIANILHISYKEFQNINKSSFYIIYIDMWIA